jgi:hypothetical protein
MAKREKKKEEDRPKLMIPKEMSERYDALLEEASVGSRAKKAGHVWNKLEQEPAASGGTVMQAPKSWLEDGAGDADGSGLELFSGFGEVVAEALPRSRDGQGCIYCKEQYPDHEDDECILCPRTPELDIEKKKTGGAVMSEEAEEGKDKDKEDERTASEKKRATLNPERFELHRYHWEKAALRGNLAADRKAEHANEEERNAYFEKMDKEQKKLEKELTGQTNTDKMRKAKNDALLQMVKEAFEAYGTTPRKARNVPFFEATPLHNIPRELLGDGKPSMPKKLLTELKEDLVPKLAEDMELGHVHEAFMAARDVAGWWKGHASAHIMAKLVMVTHGFNWAAATNVSVMCVAIALMTVKLKKKRQEQEKDVEEKIEDL